MNDAQQQKSRREMLRASARWLALGCIGVASGGLMLRGFGRTAGCRLGSCDDCRAMARCTLPPAMTAKNNKR